MTSTIVARSTKGTVRKGRPLDWGRVSLPKCDAIHLCSGKVRTRGCFRLDDIHKSYYEYYEYYFQHTTLSTDIFDIFS